MPATQISLKLRPIHTEQGKHQPEGRAQLGLADVHVRQVVQRLAVAAWQNAPCPAANPGRSGSRGSPPAASTTKESATLGASGNPAPP